MSVQSRMRQAESNLTTASHLVKSIKDKPESDVEYQELQAAARQASDAAVALYILAGMRIAASPAK